MQLKDARTQQQLTQVELAGEVGVSRSEISRWESGVCTPYPIHQKKLEEALGVSLEFGKSEEQEEKLKERPNTYFVQDRSSEDELTRLTLQSKLLTESMGGLLPEQPDPAQFKRVLDVGCGTGGWLINYAKAYPTSQCVGVDVSQRMIDYAREQARAANVNNVEFHVMDALGDFLFPAESFDLVNMRLGASFLRKWDWPVVLKKFHALTCRGGIVRFVEIIGIETNSAIFNHISEIGRRAFAQAGQDMWVESDSSSIPSQFVALFERADFQNVQNHQCTLTYSTRDIDKSSFIEDMTRLLRTGKPFLQKWTQLPDDYDVLAEQAIAEMHQDDFEATWNLLTIYGTRI